ncbi:MAG: tetratricopeptide repeat protein [Ignavibacterium sp.]|jgi:tetratricopeptide (TPR) repeat protein
MAKTDRGLKRWSWGISVLLIVPGADLTGFQLGAPSRTSDLSSVAAEVTALAEEHFRLGLAYLESPASTEKAVEHLEHAVMLNQGNAEYHYRLAEAYARDFSYANILRKPFLATRVRAELELAVRYHPASIEYREGLIQYYVMAPAILGGSYLRARAHANAMSAFDPYFSLLAHAYISAEEGDHEGAVALYSKAILMRPSAWQAYQRFGSYCLNLDETDKAIAQFEAYVRLRPDTSASYEHLASAFVRKRMYDRAIETYLKAYEADPALSALLFRIAQLYEFKGLRAAAGEYYEKYLTLAPTGRLAEDARIKLEELRTP